MLEELRLLEKPVDDPSRHELAERIPLCRFRVTAVSDASAEGPARQRGEAFTRALFEATAGGHALRARFSVGSEQRIAMHVECPRILVESSHAASSFAASLAASGFAFHRQPDGVEGVEREMVELEAPAVRARARRRGHIGFHGSSRRIPSLVALTPSGWFNSAAADEALNILSVTGIVGELEIGLTRRTLDESAQAPLEDLVAARARGDIEVFDGRRWSAPTPDLLEAIVETARDWLDHPHGLVSRIRVSAAIAQSTVAVLRRAMFTVRDWYVVGSDHETVLSGIHVVDLSGCIPAAAQFPSSAPTRPGTLRLLAPSFPQAPVKLLPKEGVSIGIVCSGSTTVEVRLTARDRQRHMLCLGASGVGKSTLLARMIAEDIAAGEGVCVIDPHGELSARVLERIPRQRVRDVFWLQPGLDNRAFGLNLLESRRDVTGRAPAVLCNELFRVFDRLYDMHQVAGPIFEQYMRSSIALVLENTRPGGTVLDVVRLFENDEFRNDLVKTCTNPVVADFWRKTASRTTGEASLRALVPYITSKLNQFVTNATVRSIVAQSTSTIDFREAMDRRAIILLDLSVGSLGLADVQLLGLLVLGKLFAAALERVADGRAGPPCRVYADEAHLFATETLSEIVSQARKGNVTFVLATQSAAQLKTSRHGSRLLESVLGNVGTFVTFRVGPFDAELLEPMFRGGLSRGDLERLPDHHAACRLLVNGFALDPFVCQTRPLESASHDTLQVMRKIRRRMRLYTKPIAEIEASIANWSPTAQEDCETS